MEYKDQNIVLFPKSYNTLASSNLKNLNQQNFLYKENITKTLII